MYNKPMRVVEVTEPGGAEVLEIGTRQIPDLKDHEVLIKVAAAGLNRADVMQRNGNYPPPPGASDILGLEVSGTVSKIGSDVSNLSVGNEVCALLAGGGYAEYCVAPATSCLPVPTGMSLVDAGALPETFFTVWTNLFMRGKLKAGERCLIHGGTSGIGLTAIQLAKAFGAEVFVTAGSDEKCAACVDFGATAAINYRTTDFVDEIKTQTNGKGVNLILDIISGEYVAKNIKCLADEGRMVIIATQGGFRAQINVLPIMTKRLMITGSTLRPRTVEQKAEIADELRTHAWPLLNEGKIKPIIDSVFSMDEVCDAHKRIESGSHIGKILLKMN